MKNVIHKKINHLYKDVVANQTSTPLSSMINHREKQISQQKGDMSDIMTNFSELLNTSPESNQ